MFDINNNLFGYIEKSSEMNDTIIQRYKNSLIFIGDEKQIYVPTTNSYVGVGMSTINNIKNSIPSIDKIYIKDIANNSLANTYTTYYFPVINGTTPNAYYYTYVALNVGVNPVSGKFIGGLQGTADYSTVSDLTYKTTTKSTNNNSSYYISFVNNINDESYTYVNNKLLYNPYEETLKSTYFVGDLKGHAETADYATYSTYTSYTTYALFNSYQSVHSINNNSKYCITFSKNLAYSLSYIDGEFYYNPALNSAYAGHFFGVFHGNVDNADTVDGFHANDLFTYFRNGDNNCAYIEIGDVEKYLQLNSYTLGGKTKEELFTNFSTEANQTTSITIGDTTKKLKIDAYKILVTEKSNNTTYPILFTNSNNLNNSNFAYTNTCISINPYYKSFAQGNNVSANAPCAHAEGTNTIAGDYAHAEGSSTKASGDTSHAEGYLSEAQGQFSHAEGQNVRAKNICSHAEGVNTEAGPYAHAEGSSTKASGDTSHAEGYLSEAQGQFSHAEGSTNRASGWCSHVGGNGSTSSGDQSFAHGSNVIASGWASFAVNANTTASGLCSFVCGQDTQALHNYEFATGHFNLSNSDTIFSVGGGNSNNNRFNLFEVTTGGKVKARDGFYKHNSNNTYILLGGGDHKLLTSLFTNFSNAGNQITSITIGGTTYTLPVDADKLDGFDANNLLSYYKSGTISSNGNTLTQANTYITVGGNTLYTNGSTCNIINSHTASGGQLTSSTNTMSLSAHTDTVNGIDSTISKSSASIINSLSVTGNQISSSVNTMILDPLTVNVNGVTDSTTKSTAQIINSLSVSTLTSTNATNLTAAIIINGVASANKTIIDLIARQIAQTSISSLSSFTNDNNLIYAAAGGSNSVSDKPTDVDAFGVLSFKTAAGWYGQLLMSSNEATGLYWRTATTLSGGWKKLLDSSNYTNYVYSKTDADDRYVLKAGDTMTGTLTLKTTGTGNYNQGIRINRTATNQWALLLIGKSGDSTYGPGTSTAGDGAWLIGTPASSNSLIFNLNDASENKGLCLKGHGNNDIKWNNNNVAHAGNIASSDASISTSLTEIATVAGVSIKAKIGNFSPSGHTHRYINSEGFSDNGTTSLSTWGTLKTANDYTGILQINESNGGSWEIAAKGGQISMQIDGYFYQNEGTYRVTDVSETVTNLYTSGTKLYWTKNGSDTGLTIPYATNAGNADTVDSYHASDLGKVNSYTLPSNKGVRITYPSHTLIIVSVCGTNSGAQLIIIGTGYGEGGRIRNQFTELVSCSLFDWSIPNSNDISRSVEVFSRRDSDSTVKVISTDGVSFTSIDALTSAKENATLLTSSNYTNYTVTKSGTGATGTWGINITGSAESASTATKLTTARTIWGQSFDGTDNVSGNMSSVGNISFSASGKNIGSILYFDTTNSRLGVGKSDPSHKLEVAGNISLYSASGDSPYLYFQRGTTSDSYNDWRINCVGGNLNFNMSSNGTWSTTPLLQLSATAGTAYLNGYTIYHSGNLTYSTLGIKQRIITIDGTEYTFYSPYDTNVTVTTTKVTQTITTSSNTDYRPLIVGYSSSSSITPTFSTTTNSVYATHRLFIQPSTGDLHLYNPDGGDSPALYFQRGDLNTSSTFDYRMYVSNGNLHIQNNQSSWNTLLYIGYDGGKIGIGTTSPSYKLDISGTIHSTDNAYFDSKVGIGTTSPSEKLDVNGNVRIRGNNEYIGTGSGSQCHMQYDDTNKCLNFIFD